MRYTTHDTWAPIRQFQREIDRLWDQRRYSQTTTGEGDDANTATWAPVVEISENSSRWLLNAELPGVETSNIDITADDGYLVIKGTKNALESDDDSEQSRRNERAFGKFYRRFQLPKDADTQKITANSKDGVLSVSIPKQPEVQPKRIPINAD